jgi:hypothetical protein
MKTTRAHAQDLAAFAFNTAMQKLKPNTNMVPTSTWLDEMVDEFEVQVREIEAAARLKALTEAADLLADFKTTPTDKHGWMQTTQAEVERIAQKFLALCGGTAPVRDEARAELDKAKEILLAIGAEDWNDETLPLLDDKMQGIGPCARARRFLGLEYREAVEKRRAMLAKKTQP